MFGLQYRRQPGGGSVCRPESGCRMGNEASGTLCLPILIHLGKLKHARRSGPGVVGWGWSQGSLKGVMSPQVWQDRSDRNSRMPQELQWCTLLLGGRSRPCSQEDRMEAAPADKGKAGI